MTEEQLQAFASQLRQPQGEFGREVGARMNIGNQHINRKAIELLELRPQDRLLEVGMGNGFFIKELFTQEPEITYRGLDFSALMIEEASKLNEAWIKAGKVNFHHATIDQMPFEAASFSKVFTINTLYFWEEPPKVLAELHRVLEDDGELFIAIRPKETMQHYPFVKYGFQMYSKEELETLLHANGFQVIASIESEEPSQQIEENTLQVKSLVVRAGKG